MSYITIDDLIDAYEKEELIRLSNLDGYSGVSIDEDVVNEIITEVEDEVDIRLSSNYTLPLTTVPKSLEVIVQKMAFIRLKERKGVIDDLYDEFKKEIEKWFDDVFKGKIILEDSTSKGIGKKTLRIKKTGSKRFIRTDTSQYNLGRY